MNNLLIISGQTATGKTGLALKLAREFGGEILSADSRQVYRGMDIGTGKDVPDEFQGFRFPTQSAGRQVSGLSDKVIAYSDGKTKIWGYDLADPSKQFSVSEYIKIGQVIIKDIWARGKLPIITGGTGLYIQGLINPPDTVGIPPNEELRNELGKLDVAELQSKLNKLDQEKFNSLNQSDRNNPRRLIRAIEIALHQDPGSIQTARSRILINDALWIGLKLDQVKLSKRIRSRVKKRLELGMIEEVKKINFANLPENAPARATIGYQEINSYLVGETSLIEATEKWIKSEEQYAKRQMTWFSKRKDIAWFEADLPNLYSQVVARVGEVIY